MNQTQTTATNVWRNVLLCALLCVNGMVAEAAETVRPGQRLLLADGWQLKSSALVPEDGRHVSTVEYQPQQWHPTSVPSTVLNALVKNGVYPDPRIGMNCYQIPDLSDEFNQKHDLAKFSYLPDKRNPWRDPYWYRTEFDLSEIPTDGCVWLEMKGINYRADVWLNGQKVADREQLVGMYQRFRLNVTQQAQVGKNCLAILIYPVDHPGVPDAQLEVLGPDRQYRKDSMKDVTFTMGVGYDCMPTIPDRVMGLWQEVTVNVTGPVDIRDPFVKTDLPLPKTSPASLTVSADLVNASRQPQIGVLRGVIEQVGEVFAKNVELAPGELKHVVCSPEEFRKLVIANPKLWWPRQYGEQNLYNLSLTFDVADTASDTEQVAFGIRKVTGKLHWYMGTPGLHGLQAGLQVHINGRRVFVRGGWLQPDMLFDMPPARIETEVRYLAEANLNTVTFEDLPAPSDAFLEMCDRYGLLYWCCFYGSFWIQPDKEQWPVDRNLLNRCGADIIKRYRNHPSLIAYSCSGEYVPAEDIYLQWRKDVRALDGTRLMMPSIDAITVFEWFEGDLPTGLHDSRAFDWRDPATYYRDVREGGTWMFNTEVSIGSVPPVDSLQRFMPDLFAKKAAPGSFPLDQTWAHHGANRWYKVYDDAIRRLYGEPESVVDYCHKAQLVSAAQHRAWSEAVNHRMWEVTSGIWQWKLNSCWPDVNWQIYDWYLQPMPNLYYYRSAFEPLHVQLSPLDSMVTVINRRTDAEKEMSVDIAVYDSDSKLCWKKSAPVDAAGDTYTDVLAIPHLDAITPVYFVDLQLRNAAGEVVSRNFYWLSAKEPPDYRPLDNLPPVRLTASHEVERLGEESAVRVRVENPTDRLAFFIHLALTRSHDREEILPIFWSDNYFSLAPHESREVVARIATGALEGEKPVLEIGGWNIESDFDCRTITVSQTEIKAGESLAVTANVANTFLDGSRVTLFVDGKPCSAKWAWARGDKTDEVVFHVRLTEPGDHRLTVGKRDIKVKCRQDSNL